MRAVKVLLAALLSFAVVVGLQLRSGAYEADFDATEDEPAHVVTSLMVHDYLVSGRLSHPWEFATAYYVHYPKVAMLHWPPVFHLSEAIWMLGTHRSRAALLGFQSLVGAALVFSVFLFVRRDYGLWIGLFAALLAAASPPMQTAASMVSPDTLLGAVVFWAAIAYPNRCWFWVLTLVALGIHGRAAPLLIVPALAILLTRPSGRRFLTPIVIVFAVVAAYLLLPRFFGHAYSTDVSTIMVDGGGYLIRLGEALSWPVLLLALIGLWMKNEMRALVVSCWIFHAMVRVPFADYFLVTAIPATVVLAASGASAIWARGAQWRFATGVGLVAIALWGCGSGLLYPQGKRGLGARSILEQSGVYRDAQKIWLVAGTATFEGALIAEAALRDHAMEHIVLRGSKMLAHSTWNGTGYRMLYSDTASIMSFLDQAHVGWIAIRPDRAAPAHVVPLEVAVQANARIWRRIASPAEGIALFQRIEPLPGFPKIEIDLRDKLGTFVRLP